MFCRSSPNCKYGNGGLSNYEKNYDAVKLELVWCWMSLLYLLELLSLLGWYLLLVGVNFSLDGCRKENN